MSQNDQNMTALMRVNQALYAPLSDLSIVASQNLSKQYSTQTEYNQQDTIQFNIQSTEYVRGVKSYIKLDIIADAVVTAGTPTATFGNSSALSLIQKATLDKGSNIETAEDLNLYQHQKLRWSESSGKRSNWLKIMGANSTVDYYQSKQTVIIPLQYIFGFFDASDEQLIPPMALSGSIMKLVLAGSDLAFNWGAGATYTSTSYKVSNVELYLSEYKLDESAEQRLLQLSRSSTGLTYKYTSREHMSVYLPQTTVMSKQVSPPLSNVLSVFATVRDEERITGTGARLVNSFNSKQPPLDGKMRWNYKIGSQQYPKQDVTSRAQSFMQATEALVKDTNDCNVSLSNFVDVETNPTAGCFVLAHNYNRSNIGAMSGLNINNNLQQYLYYADDDNDKDLRVDVFTTAVRALQVFSNGKIVVSN